MFSKLNDCLNVFKLFFICLLLIITNNIVFSQNTPSNTNKLNLKTKQNPLHSRDDKEYYYGIKGGINKSDFFFSTLITDEKRPIDDFVIGVLGNYNFKHGNHIQLEVLYSKKRQDFYNERFINNLDLNQNTFDIYYAKSISMSMIEVPIIYVVETLNLKYFTHTVYFGHFVSINILNNLNFSTVRVKDGELLRNEKSMRFDFSNDMGLSMGTQFYLNYISANFFIDLRFNIPYYSNDSERLDILPTPYKINYFNTAITLGITL